MILYRHYLSSVRKPFYRLESDQLYTRIRDISKVPNDLSFSSVAVSAKHRIQAYTKIREFKDMNEVEMYFKNLYPEEFI